MKYTFSNKGLDILKDGLDFLNISFDSEKIKKIEIYYNELVEKNKVMNLTSITDEEDYIKKHILDSLAVTKFHNMNNVTSLIDIGTGAGFPGLPLKVFYPHIKTVLLDSLNKRINFLNDVIRLLELDGIEAIHGRAEDYGQNEQYREKFDLCVSRAVSRLEILSEYCIPFVNMHGYFISYKSSNSDQEISGGIPAISILGGSIIDTIDFTIDDPDLPRRFVLIEKISQTDKKYPRKAGKPQKKPLK